MQGHPISRIAFAFAATLLSLVVPARAQAQAWPWQWFLPSDRAEVVRHTIPDSLRAGDEVDVLVEVRNTGKATWRSPAYKLGAVGDAAGDAAKFTGANADPHRVSIPPGVAVRLNGRHVFRFRLRAPAQPGVYRPQWRMVREGVRWFGPVAGRVVRVDPAPAPAPTPTPAPAPAPAPSPAPAPHAGRPGLVRLAGNALEDDAGRFNALGTTLFWAAWGYKYDRPRLDAALDTLARNGFDYIRALGVVGDPNDADYWDGREILWTWPDYRQVIAELTDYAYDRYGLRVHWTLIGDGQVSIPRAEDRRRLCDWFLEMSRGREHKIILFEIANEYYQNGFDGSGGLRQLRELSRYMKDRTDILVAASAPQSADSEDVYPVYQGGVADIATIHFDRDSTKIEGTWRPVRQVWHHAYNQPTAPPGCNNEPIGPGASVASENDPVRLVAGAVATYVSNISMYCYHTRAGVRGDVDISTMPGVDSFRAVKSFVPRNVSNWTRQNAHWRSSPFKCYAIDERGGLHEDQMWPDQGPRAQGGAVRVFSQVSGDEFVAFPFGVRNRLVMEPRRSCDFEVIDPMTGRVISTHSLSAGQRFELTGGEIFFIRGRYR